MRAFAPKKKKEQVSHRMRHTCIEWRTAMVPVFTRRRAASPHRRSKDVGSVGLRASDDSGGRPRRGRNVREPWFNFHRTSTACKYETRLSFSQFKLAQEKEKKSNFDWQSSPPCLAARSHDYLKTRREQFMRIVGAKV